jgi:hypothetical protein
MPFFDQFGILAVDKLSFGHLKVDKTAEYRKKENWLSFPEKRMDYCPEGQNLMGSHFSILSFFILLNFVAADPLVAVFVF